MILSTNVINALHLLYIYLLLHPLPRYIRTALTSCIGLIGLPCLSGVCIYYCAGRRIYRTHFSLKLKTLRISFPGRLNYLDKNLFIARRISSLFLAPVFSESLSSFSINFSGIYKVIFFMGKLYIETSCVVNTFF